MNWPFWRSPCFHTPLYRTTICFSVCLRRLAHWVSTPLGLRGFFNQENNINNITHVILCYSAFKQTYTHNYVLMCSTCLHINRKENKENKNRKKKERTAQSQSLKTVTAKVICINTPSSFCDLSPYCKMCITISLWVTGKRSKTLGFAQIWVLLNVIIDCQSCKRLSSIK